MSPEEEDQPASPGARLMQAPGFNLCILTILGFKTRIDVNLFIKTVEQTLLKHPRFSTVPVTSNENAGNFSWRRTSVDIRNHVFALDLDPDMESPDEFVEDFVSDLSRDSMDPTKPLWEFHILNVKTSDANSTVIIRAHHSMGDGVSLISLLLACAKKMSDPKYLPVLPSKKRELAHINDGSIKRLLFWVWMIFSIIFNTLTDLISLLATILFLKDTKTPIKGERGIDLSRKRFVHRIISLDDVKLVKNAMNVSINDVMLGVVGAGVGRYLNMIYAEKHIQNGKEVIVKKLTNYLPKNIRIRSAIAINLRPSPTIKELAEIMEKGKELNGNWGNKIGFTLLPLTIDLQEQDDPLACIRRAKANMDRKKLSFGPQCSFLLIKLGIKLLGVKVVGAVMNMLSCNTTLGFSNVAGPREEVTLFGHPLSYLAPTVSGVPAALVIHLQSYANKLIISIAADEILIPNPHKLCDDLVISLENVKQTVIKNGIFKGSKTF